MASRVFNLHKYQHPTALYLLEDFYVFFSGNEDKNQKRKESALTDSG